ncbi:hypothetical protein [Streptacidiphilus cavernicola]|uniref:Transglutaminase-like domain-containing protein n=1 Tax=Streptacidiphilus cavernicola TaxID=3342716 RepID=A0ABV6VY96_9ACTN
MTACDRIRLFEQVRAVPYGTDGAHDAQSLLTAPCGDCLAKSAYLLQGFAALGLRVRRVRWLYLLPPHPAQVALLPSRQDVHTALEVAVGGVWVLVDATHDPGLAAAGFTVAQWDGTGPTAPAYPAVGPVWRAGDPAPEPVPNASLDEEPDPSAVRAYQAAYNRWLREVRAGA